MGNFLGEVGFKAFDIVPVYCDRTGGVMSVAANRLYKSSHTKHVALRFFFSLELWSRATRSPFTTRADWHYTEIGTKHLSVQQRVPLDHATDERLEFELDLFEGKIKKIPENKSPQKK